MSSDRPILELNRVSFSYSGTPFIKDIALSFKEADYVGLLGANGSGKSTLLKLLSGILRPGNGSVTLWGNPIASFKNKDRAKLISYLPQVLDVSAPFRVSELAAMGLYPYEGALLPPAGKGATSPGGEGSMTSVEEALGIVGLGEKKDALITNLSGGERRRAFIAMTLVQGAGILLLDEPLANLDIKYQLEIIRLLRELNKQRKITIVMALHDINLARQFDRLMLVKEGRLLGEGPPEEILKENLLKEAFDVSLDIKRNGQEIFITYREV